MYNPTRHPVESTHFERLGPQLVRVLKGKQEKRQMYISRALLNGWRWCLFSVFVYVFRASKQKVNWAGQVGILTKM